MGDLLRGVAKSCVVVAVCVGLPACAVVDEYSGRAVVYNLQAEQAQEQALLLNVVRASVRRPMQFTGLQPSPVQVRVSPPQNPFPRQRCPFEENTDGYRCTNLFVVEEGGSGVGGIAVDYEGRHYSISADTGSSWTMPVFDVVKQLQAVNTSAKQLPASNLISVLSN